MRLETCPTRVTSRSRSRFRSHGRLRDADISPRVFHSLGGQARVARRCLSLRACEVSCVGPASVFSPTGSPGGRSTRSSSGRTPGVAARADSSTCLSTGSRSRSSSLSTTGSGDAPSRSAQPCTAPVCSASSMRAAGCCAGSSATPRGTMVTLASASTGSFGSTTFRSGRRTVSAWNASTTCSRAGQAHLPLADHAVQPVLELVLRVEVGDAVRSAELDVGGAAGIEPVHAV